MSKPALRRTQRMFRCDVRAIRNMAQEVLRQCDFYERNGKGDELRFMLISIRAKRLAKLADRADRRYLQEPPSR